MHGVKLCGVHPTMESSDQNIFKKNSTCETHSGVKLCGVHCTSYCWFKLCCVHPTVKSSSVESSDQIIWKRSRSEECIILCCLAWRWVSQCGVELCVVHPTGESDSAVCISPWVKLPGMHYASYHGGKLRSVHPTVESSDKNFLFFYINFAVRSGVDIPCTID